MKNIYDENDRYTLEANRLDEEVRALILPLFERYVREGWSVRQISHLMQGTIYELELRAMLRNAKTTSTFKFSEL